MDLEEIKLTTIYILLVLGLYDEDVVEALNEVFAALEKYLIYIIVTVIMVIVLFNL